ncbi:transcription factor bHLH51-like isoform X2 [Bidens hawaiensis]|uniref:transcription factor bHLH51-like isoform X2 n=1 Tax=Bidens hawaiensis TaxID=980011 RepID=UPI0040497CFE
MDDFVWSWTQNSDVDQYNNWDHSLVSPSENQFSDSDRGGGEGSGGGNGGDGAMDDGKVGSASKNHSEAEKRRRDRINAHLATLRKLISSSEKMDKATLLGKVVEHVKQVQSETKELSKVFTIPTNLDEVIIDHDLNTKDPTNDVLIRASVCCEDRAELFSEIKHSLKSLRLTMVQADMTCLGGRIICNFILRVTTNTSKNEITTLKESLKVLLGRIVSSSSWTLSSHYRIKSKRQRFFCSSNYDTSGC